MKKLLLPLFMTSILATSAYAVDLGVSHEELAKMKASYRERPKHIPAPKTNPYSKAKYNLGRTLFFDPILSGSKKMSCATCHNPSMSWVNGASLAVSDKCTVGKRKIPTLLNIAWDHVSGWSGKYDSLEEQAIHALPNPDQQNVSLEVAMKRLQDIPGYVKMFKAAFPHDKHPVNPKNLGKAIATFERHIVSHKAPFDFWLEGNEKAISDDAKKGFVIFNKKANCVACHSTWRFTDGSFRDIGLASTTDIGHAEVKQASNTKYAFKTPTLRNINKRAPYMHNASLKTLGDVVDHYSDNFVKRESLSPEMKPLKLTNAEKKQLLAFLNTLTSIDAVETSPVLPRVPGVAVE